MQAPRQPRDKAIRNTMVKDGSLCRPGVIGGEVVQSLALQHSWGRSSCVGNYASTFHNKTEGLSDP